MGERDGTVRDESKTETEENRQCIVKLRVGERGMENTEGKREKRKERGQEKGMGDQKRQGKEREGSGRVGCNPPGLMKVRRV